VSAPVSEGTTSAQRILATVALASCAILSGCGGGGDIVSGANAASSSTQVDRLRFILRPDATGRWFIQNDQDHASEGVHLNVEQGGDYLRVYFTQPYRFAGVIQITSDDDFGSRITGHGNLGLSSTTIRVMANGVRIDPSRVWDHIPVGGGNFWVSVEMVR